MARADQEVASRRALEEAGDVVADGDRHRDVHVVLTDGGGGRTMHQVGRRRIGHDRWAAGAAREHAPRHRTRPATAVAISAMRRSRRSRSLGSIARVVPSSSAESAMTLKAVPAVTRPMVITAGENGDVSRLMIDWMARITCAVTTTGSIAVCGMPPCPPRPWIVTEKLSALPKMTPDLTATRPVCERRPEVDAEDAVDALGGAVGDHRHRAGGDLLGRLEAETHAPRPAVAQRNQRGRRPERHGHVAVVAAGVHHTLDTRR